MEEPGCAQKAQLSQNSRRVSREIRMPARRASDVRRYYGGRMAPKNILIEGWRGINHSYALVNQFQLLELRKRPELALFHRDLPFYRPEWNEARNHSGFSATQRAAIDAIPRYESQAVDAVYRIAFPYRVYGAESSKIYCFGTAEYQRLGPDHFYRGSEANAAYSNNSVKIVAPSNWSRAGFLASGYGPDDVIVVPHGIDPATFHPLSAAERVEARKMFGLNGGQFAFLNVSAMTRNKGVDRLVSAFSLLRRKHPHALLLLKDQSNLYGLDAHVVLRQVQDADPRVFDGGILDSIKLVSRNLTLGELRALYGACDAYVSPYRAEGFNLPPLEAAACGTPIIVTAGGATDDYYHRSFALKIASARRSEETVGVYLEPDLDSLVDCMETVLEQKDRNLDRLQGAEWIKESFSWSNVARRLASLF
jgi:glycosyltransferase involved in cell wall biosynthesis